MRTKRLVLSLLLVGCTAQEDQSKARMPSSVDDGGGATTGTGDSDSGGGSAAGSGSGTGTNGTSPDIDASATGAEADGGSGGSTTGNNGMSSGGVSGGGGTTSGTGCACEADERCTPEGRCEAACACDDTQGVCDEGCACDHACGPARCAAFIPTFEYLSAVATGIDLWDRNTGIASGWRGAMELRDGLWSHLHPGDRRFSAVGMDSATSAWALGDVGVRRWKDGVWSQAAGFGDTVLARLRVTRDGYGLTLGGGAFSADPVEEALFMLEDGTWRRSSPGANLGEYVAADVVSGGGAWLSTTTHLARFDGASWQTWPTDRRFSEIALFDLDNGWAHTRDDALYQLKSGVWSAQPVAKLDGTIRALRVGQSQRAFAVTDEPSFYQLVGETWTKMATKTTCGPGRSYCGNDVYDLAIVDGLAVVTSIAGMWTLRDPDTTWRYTEVPGYTSSPLSAIAFTDSTGYVVSNKAWWLRREGMAWKADPSVYRALAIDLGAEDVPWVVGEDGFLAHLELATDEWAEESFFNIMTGPQPRPTSANLYGIAMNADGSGWAVGGDVGVPGVVLRRSAGVWKKHPFAPSDELHAIALEGPDTGWAVGGSSIGRTSVIARLENGVWREVESPTEWSLWALALDEKGDGWAVGGTQSPAASVVLRLKDGLWSVAPMPSEPTTLRAIALDRNGFGWAAGTRPPVIALRGDTATSCPDAVDRSAWEETYGAAIDADGRTWLVGANGFRAHSP